MEFDINKWMTSKREGEVLLEHFGAITSSYIDSVLPVLEERLQDGEMMANINKRVFHIFVECSQNLYHHVEPFSAVEKKFGNDRLSFIAVVREGETFRISSGNFVNKAKRETLKAKIDDINTYDKDGIKDLYRKTMNNMKFSDKGGAGLGLIDVARKSFNKLGYDFYEVPGEPDILFFSLDVRIS